MSALISVKPERLVEFAVGQQPGVGRDLAAQEFQLQPAVETDPQIARFGSHPLGSPVSMARIGRTPLFFKGVAQIACQSEGTHLGNRGVGCFSSPYSLQADFGIIHREIMREKFCAFPPHGSV